MKFGTLVRAFGAIALLLCSTTAWAANSVIVDSRSLNPGETGIEVKIKIENDATLKSVSVPVALRTVEGAAFMTSMRCGWGDRLEKGFGFPLTDFIFTNTYAMENGNCKDNTPGGFGTITFNDTTAHPVAGSPLGVLFFRGKSFSDPLLPGADSVGSLRLLFDVTTTQGVFEIDTTCSNPANHLLFVEDVTNGAILPSFTKGIISVGNPPVARDTSWSTNENTAHAVAYLPASDPDGDGLTFSIADGPEHGAVSGFNPANGAFLYTPDTPYTGADSLTFEATDGGFVSAAKVRITVIDVNDPPIARDTAIVTDEDVPVDAQLQAYDTDSPTLTYERLTGPSHGSITAFDAATGEFTYLPNANYNGADAMTFRANDGITNSNPATVSITINPINDPPFARDTNLVVPFETAVNARFQAYDVDGPSFTFSQVSGPFNGTMTGFDAGTGTFTYTPDTDYSGPDSIKFTADDGSGPGNVGTVRISVSSSNCVCSTWGDPKFDGHIDVQDLGRVIQTLFENYLPTKSPKCPVYDADYNCDCHLDVIDMGILIDYLFAGLTDLCDPCSVNCSSP